MSQVREISERLRPPPPLPARRSQPTAPRRAALGGNRNLITLIGWVCAGVRLCQSISRRRRQWLSEGTRPREPRPAGKQHHWAIERRRGELSLRLCIVAINDRAIDSDRRTYAVLSADLHWQCRLKRGKIDRRHQRRDSEFSRGLPRESTRCSSQMTGNAATQRAPIAQKPAGPKCA
jgi:hypothetical protein